MLRPVLDQFLSLAATALVGLLVALATQGLRRLSLNLSAQQEAQLRYYVERAVHAVEESVAGPGAEKLTAAVELLQRRYPQIPIRELTDAIHAELARQRADVGNELFTPKG